jgi:signal transduction histidine kinase
MTTADTRTPVDRGPELLRSLTNLSHTILRRARSAMSRIELLQEISEIIIDSSSVAIAEWWLREGDGYFRCQVSRDSKGRVRWEADNLDVTHPDEGIIVGTREQQALSRIYLELIGTDSGQATEELTGHGSFWACNRCREDSPGTGDPRSPQRLPFEDVPDNRCFMLIPLRGGDEDLGFISLKAQREAHFSRQQLELYELVAESVAVALVHQDAQSKLRERVKEIGCLYEVVRLADNPDLSLDEVLQGVANLLPPAWQYPNKAAGRVVLDGRSYTTQGFAETSHIQSAAIVVGGEERGGIEVVYLEERPRMHEGPFLKEERHLINALAREVSGIIERRQAREEQARLEDQLRHADRLATIGQLAAGVAHELNEPLGNILGFAQLADKADGLPDKPRRDIAKIIDACLFSRKVVSKLKLFARQMPAQRTTVDLNKMITEELFFIESRCTKQGVTLQQELDPELPTFEADSGQLYQVLVNLAVNAVQAMPDGGVLTIRTRNLGDRVALGVSDTGVGMSDEVKDKIFVPFYTTKEVDQGTGLGLSVVHGIVSAHGGTIDVVSAPQTGSIFEVCLPIETKKEAFKDDKR